MVAKKADVKIKEVSIPLEWHMPEGVVTPLAFNMTVQIMEDVFKLSFFEFKPPIQIDKSEPAPTKIRADCVASIFVTPDRLPRFINVLQQNLDKYMKIKQST